MRRQWFFYILAVLFVGGLLVLFPSAFAFVELAAREIRYLWWVILLVALGVFLIWGFRIKKR